MRLVFTVINDLTYDQRMNRICQSLAEKGHAVLLVGRKIPDSLPLTPKSFEQKRLRVFFRKGKLFYIEYNLRLLVFLLFHGFDAVCAIDLDTVLPCYFSAGLKMKKCAYDAHELFPEVPEVIRRPFTRLIWQFVERFAVKRIKNCYTVSEGLADYFNKKYSRHFEVIRNVPVLEPFSEATASPGSERFIFYQGALNEGRGLEHLIAAMAKIPMRLKIAGEGDLSEQLRKSVTELQLQDRVIFLGRLLPDALKDITRQAFLGVNFLENKGLSYYYSLANKFFDYVQAAVPVITMDFPEYRRLNNEFEVAILINNLKTETIVEAMLRFIENKDAYFRCREHCLHARQVWNWQEEEKKLTAFYASLK